MRCRHTPFALLRIGKVIDGDLVAASIFGDIHGVVGAPQERVGVILGTGGYRDADAYGDAYVDVVDCHSLADRDARAVGKLGCVARMSRAFEEDDELVTTDAGERVVLADHGIESQGGRLKHCVTAAMPVGV